jgi:hypothetical protein
MEDEAIRKDAGGAGDACNQRERVEEEARENRQLPLCSKYWTVITLLL